MDVFISYNWNLKTKVEKLYEILTKQLNFKVWLDQNQLSAGNELTSKLAEAIDNSKAFLCCLTTDYCKSKICNSEFNYANKSNKPMIILMIENLTPNEITKIHVTGSNNPCGIGLLISNLLWIDCHKNNNWPITEIHKALSTKSSFLLEENQTIRLIQECKNFTDIVNQDLYKLKDLKIEKICEDPFQMKGWEEDFDEYIQTKYSLSKELTNFLKNNSKMINWPVNFKTKSLLNKYKSEFLKLKWHHLGSAWRDFAWSNSLALSSWMLVHKTLGKDWTYSYVVFENSNQDLEEKFRPKIAFVVVTTQVFDFEKIKVN